MEYEMLQQILGKLDDLSNGMTEMRGEIAELRGDNTEIRSEMAEMRGSIARLEKDLADVKELAESTHLSVVRIELAELPKIQVALDGVVSNIEKLKDHSERIFSLEETSDRHTIEIALLKEAK